MAAGRKIPIRVFVLLAAFGFASPAQVHRSPMAGKWYPADKLELSSTLQKAFQAASTRAGDAPRRNHLRALIVPHAAIQYSGVVAASAYRLVGSPRNIIVLGFSHRKPLRSVVAPAVASYVTPLGELPVNRTLVTALGFPMVGEAGLCDHSLENQLPWLQTAAPEAGFVPLYTGELSPPALAAAAARLAARMRAGDLVIASSDFTHYGKAYGYAPYPNDAQIRTRLFRQAMAAFEEISSIRVAGFNDYLEATGDTICGREPIRLLLAALAALEKDEEIYMEAVDWMTSGELTGDFSASVTYGALAFYPASAFAVDPEDQRKLLASARQTLDRFLNEKTKMPVPVPPAERSPALNQRAGVFVTIKKNGELRGCVGNLAASQPLWRNVPDRTLAAITADPRFPPLSNGDGPVTLEISLLTPLKKLASWQELRLGKGAVLLLEGKAATLLPQVAAEMGWTREQFLEQLARKAGLAPTAYRHPRARLYVFDAQVFGEPSPQTVDGVPRRGQ